VLSLLTNAAVAITEFISMARGGSKAANWAKAVLGAMSPDLTEQKLVAAGLADEIRPLQMLSAARNWTKVEAVETSINFLRKQTVSP
jgi:hypothetical protein